MNFHKFAAACILFSTLAFVTSASALPMKDGTMFIVTANGEIKMLPKAHKNKIPAMIKVADPSNGEMAVMIVGNKFYTVKNHPTENGLMTYDLWGINR
jgi:hypothetical protein